MIKLGLSALLLLVVKTLLWIAVGFGAAAALTSLVDVPEPWGTVTWIAASLWAFYVLLGLVIVLLAFWAATSIDVPGQRRKRR